MIGDKKYTIIRNALYEMEQKFADLCEHYHYWPDQGDSWVGSMAEHKLDRYLRAMSELRTMLTNEPFEERK